jgi:hypothetical protein
MSTNIFLDQSFILPIVEVVPGANISTKALFSIAVKGSVFIAIKRINRIWIYFEGGIYSRQADQVPTLKEKIDYAVLAAGRAIQDYPTVAKFLITDESDLVRVGEVDTNNWEAQFYMVNTPAIPGQNHRRPRELTDLNLNEYHMFRQDAIHFQFLVCLYNRIASKSMLDLWLAERYNLSISCAHDISNSVEKENCFLVSRGLVEWLRPDKPDIADYPGLLEFVDAYSKNKISAL